MNALDDYSMEVQLLGWGDGPNGPWIRLQLDDISRLETFRPLPSGPTNGQRMGMSLALINDDESVARLEPEAVAAETGPDSDARPANPGAKRECGPDQAAANAKIGRPVPEEAQQLVDDPVRQSVDCWRLCDAPDFRRYLKAEYEDVWRKTMRDADMSINKFAGAVVSNLCSTHTRAAFDYHGEPRRLWMSLRTMYGYWRTAQGLDRDSAEQRMGEAGG